ncbi:hypothetical protein G1H11_17900 [Phytoactinopolyspora alkaliphila]|uniref:LppX_LprAFG lipoprotein n=1 Tax=Phytoactinopolyspora alkaliphila TaxID=1783498 RepID=A0A6N9YQ44_9ACTN|nr:hypothetical protein [Phytoactinopolyspora alkaliphila]NED97176.1 hypothetical protein [Phytoactinopolyspora alkaliphila]
MQLASGQVIGLGLAALLTVTLTACGEEETPPGPAPLAQIASSSETAPAENGVDQLPPEEALRTAVKNLAEAGTYRVSGMTSAGSAIDIAFKTGVGSVGTVTTDSEVRLVASDDVVYITSDPATLADIVDADIEDTIADKWLLISSESSSNYRIFVEGSDFAEAVLGSEVKGDPTAVQEVDGVPAVGIEFAESGGMLWISATGDPLPLRFEEKGASGGSGVLTFSDFGEDVEVPTPDEDDVVDLSTLPVQDDEDE